MVLATEMAGLWVVPVVAVDKMEAACAQVHHRRTAGARGGWGGAACRPARRQGRDVDAGVGRNFNRVVLGFGVTRSVLSSEKLWSGFCNIAIYRVTPLYLIKSISMKIYGEIVASFFAIFLACLATFLAIFTSFTLQSLQV